MFCDQFIADLLLCMSVKKIEYRLVFDTVMAKIRSLTVFDHPVYISLTSPKVSPNARV